MVLLLMLSADIPQLLTPLYALQISGQTYGELRIVPDMHTRKVRPTS